MRIRIGPVRGIHVVGVIIGVCTALFCAATPSFAAADSARCQVALSMVKAGEPRKAAELVDLVRKDAGDQTVCDDASTLAADAIAQSDAKAANAAAELADKKWQEAADSAGEALRVDSGNTYATGLLTKAEAGEAGEDRSLADWVDRLADRWSDDAAEVGKDLGVIGLAVAGAFALVLLLARLLLLAPLSLAAQVRATRSGPSTWALVLAYIALAAAVGIATPYAVSGAGLTNSGALWILGCLIIAAVLVWATMATWFALFYRRRVRIDMQEKGADGKAGAAAIVTHLRKLGASPPRGLEIPLGADVAALSGANITSSFEGWLGTLLSVVQTTLAITPWRVLVDKDSDDQTVVVVSRHGRVVASEVIKPKVLGKDGPEVDAHKLVAALALFTILDEDDSLEGMAGARDWMSVALQYDVATTPGRKPEQRTQLLALAVDMDPGNWVAQFSYRMLLSRDSEDANELRVLTNWLTAGADMLAAEKVDGSANAALVARMRYAAYAIRLNHRVVLAPERCGCTVSTATLFTKLTMAIGQLKDPQQALLQSRLRSAAAALDENVLLPVVSWTQELTPTSAYSLACHLAQRPDAASRAAAIAYLAFAYGDPRRKSEAPSDPSLKALRKTAEYRKALGEKPPSDLMATAPFNAHKTTLEAVGLTEPALIALTSVDRLAGILGYPKLVARDVRKRAALVAAVPSALDSHRLLIVSTLVDAGVLGPSSLAALLQDPSRRQAVRTKLRTTCETKGYPDPGSTALDDWLPPDPATN